MKIECDRVFAFNPFDGFENIFGIEKMFFYGTDSSRRVTKSYGSEKCLYHTIIFENGKTRNK